jgi:hypothetical protein
LPFYVKLSKPGLLPGSDEVLRWLGDTALRAGIPLGLAFAALRRSLLPALAMVVALTVFFLLPEHLMGYESRYLAPLDPTIAALFGMGIAAATRHRITPRLERGRGPALVALSLLPCLLGIVEAPASFGERLAYADGLEAAHEALGRQLRSLPGSRVALSDAGAIPYLSGWWTLDLIGLNDARIATTGDRDPSRVLDASPDVLVLASMDAGRFAPWDWNAWETPLFEAAIRRGFVRVSVRRFAADYFLWVLVPKGSPLANRLATP